MGKAIRILKIAFFILAFLIALCIMMIRTDEHLSRHASQDRSPITEQDVPSPAPKNGRL